MITTNITVPKAGPKKHNVGFQSTVERAFKSMKNQIGEGRLFAASAKQAVGLESINDADYADLTNTMKDVAGKFLSVGAEAYAEANHRRPKGTEELGLTRAQLDAATAAALYAEAPAQWLKTDSDRVVSVESRDGGLVVPVRGADLERLRVSLEAYDERENRNIALYSSNFNMFAAHQDEFGEAFYPTVTVPLDQAGFSIAARITRIVDDIKRDKSGKTDDLHARNIVQAVVDPTILRNDITKVVPVLREDSEQYFIDPALVAPGVEVVDNKSVDTAPLRTGVEIGLLAISQTDAMLAQGQAGYTDSLDSSIYLREIYIKIKGAAQDGSQDGVLKFDVEQLGQSGWNYALQGDYRDMVLNFRTDALLITPDSKKPDGTALPGIAPIVSGGYKARLTVRTNGQLNLRDGNVEVDKGTVRLDRLTKDKTVYAKDTDTFKEIAAIFETAEIAGYTLKVNRTNSDIRQRGQLIDNTWQYQLYPIPIGAPISILHPMNQGDANDAADVASLVTAARITVSNAAVTAIFKARDLLAQYANNDDAIGYTPVIFGVASRFLKPYYNSLNFDAKAVVDSLKSQDRARDLSSALVNMIRNEVFKAHTYSAYKATAEARNGGPVAPPTVIIGGDPIVTKWIMIEGDLRTLSPDFNLKIVSTLDNRMTGKLFISFGNFGGENQGVPDWLHFGNLGWRPELVLNLPISRQGTVSRELVVQPSFLHVTHLPILIEINVSGIEDVVNEKVAITAQTA